ncbi:hypothetical protein Nepgr_014844 [Nepenthes gracilis]|uniref:Uncharacterized protein n=1 Tax=Nepenthes gracilis TaxID=150966 RepID=A0AAD3XQ80_NEPGR|nr:hypothetical protein Nepgr_014844 [Nepenthes gracilis]
MEPTAFPAAAPSFRTESNVKLLTSSKRVLAAIHTQHHLPAVQANRQLQLHEMATTGKPPTPPAAPV